MAKYGRRKKFKRYGKRNNRYRRNKSYLVARGGIRL